ncbi:E3 ubiquitin-protein ligase TOM1-like [Astathelohania contejeani]|uniref:HECT-type E3 ubiquitin transferase n=1 Tax=Astathelohania contejeani TaxID=164912 RepID=A0ABQ7I203_9MICR|nr:E3 ubiquitin-protein ligase TOM1-like [Thelohania contejeani]
MKSLSKFSISLVLLIFIPTVSYLCWLKYNNTVLEKPCKNTSSQNELKYDEIIKTNFKLIKNEYMVNLPVQIREFTNKEIEFLKNYFANIIKSKMVDGILNHYTFYLIFTDNIYILKLYINSITEIINTIHQENTKDIGEILLPKKFEITIIMKEVLNTYSNISSEHPLIYIKKDDKNYKNIKIAAFVTYCSFYFYFSGKYIYPFENNLNVANYLIMISKISTDKMQKAIVLFEILMILKNNSYNISDLSKSTYSNEFPINIMILDNKLSCEFIELIRQKYIDNTIDIKSKLKILAYFLLNSECQHKSFLNYIEFDTEIEFFKFYLNKIFLENIVENQIFEILKKVKNQSLMIKFLDVAINEVLMFFDRDNIEKENMLLFIMWILNKKKYFVNINIEICEYYDPNYEIYKTNMIEKLFEDSDIKQQVVISLNDSMKFCIDIDTTYEDVLELKLIYKNKEIYEVSKQLYEKRDEKDYKLLFYLIINLQQKLSNTNSNILVIGGGADWIADKLNNDESFNMNNIDFTDLLQKISDFQQVIFFSPLYEFQIDTQKLLIDSKNAVDEEIKKRNQFSSNIHNYYISFLNSPGVFGDGVFKSWMSLLSIEFTKEEQLVFRKNEDFFDTFIPVVVNEIDVYHLELENDLRLIGRLIGIALSRNTIFPIEFSKSVYKLLLGKIITAEDIFDENQSISKRLNDIKEMCADENNGMFFIIYCVKLVNGKYQLDSEELCPDGENKLVTNENYTEYKKLYLKKEIESLKNTIKIIKKGILDMVPEDVFNSIKYIRVLKSLISGYQVIDIEDWKQNTIYIGWNENENTIKWFWEFVEDCKQKGNKIKLLLMGLTGSYNTPIGGFGNLLHNRFTINYYEPNTEKKLLVHTCSNTIDMGRFQSKESLFDIFEELILSLDSEILFDWT